MPSQAANSSGCCALSNKLMAGYCVELSCLSVVTDFLFPMPFSKYSFCSHTFSEYSLAFCLF